MKQNKIVQFRAIFKLIAIVLIQSFVLLNSARAAELPVASYTKAENSNTLAARISIGMPAIKKLFSTRIFNDTKVTTVITQGGLDLDINEIEHHLFTTGPESQLKKLFNEAYEKSFKKARESLRKKFSQKELDAAIKESQDPLSNLYRTLSEKTSEEEEPKTIEQINNTYNLAMNILNEHGHFLPVEDESSWKKLFNEAYEKSFKKARESLRKKFSQKELDAAIKERQDQLSNLYHTLSEKTSEEEEPKTIDQINNTYNLAMNILNERGYLLPPTSESQLKITTKHSRILPAELKMKRQTQNLLDTSI